MKNLMTAVLVLMITIGFGQTNTSRGIIEKQTTKIESVALTVTVDSAEEIESSFNVEDVKELLATTSSDETISFKLTCNGEEMSNGKKSHMSYKIEGNTSKRDNFFKLVEKIRASAIDYYNNKKKN